MSLGKERSMFLSKYAIVCSKVKLSLQIYQPMFIIRTYSLIRWFFVFPFKKTFIGLRTAVFCRIVFISSYNLTMFSFE